MAADKTSEGVKTEMKTWLICAVLLGGAVAASAQGVIYFNNRIGGDVLEAPIYGPIPSDNTLSLRGNTITGKPVAGIVDYLGAALLGGSAYWAELWVLDGGVFEVV